MNEKRKFWAKGPGVPIAQDVFIHGCGEVMKMVGSAGCSHDGDFTYFYQCPRCKDVESSGRCLPRHGHADEEFMKAGYKPYKHKKLRKDE